MSRVAFIILSVIVIVFGSQTACRASGGSNSSDGQQRRAPSSLTNATGEFTDREFRNRSGERMPYRLFVPANYDARRSYPLALWLHGSGARGDDLRLLAGADASGLDFLSKPEHQAQNPCFIVAPQCPANGRWDAGGADEMSNQMRLVLEIIGSVRASYNIDAARLYVLGISLGGHGAWDIIARRPQMFAAAVPICGRGDTTKAALVARTPVWAFHGDADQSVPVEGSRRMVAAVRSAGGSPRYTEYRGVGHNSWERAFQEPELLTWIFAQRRE